MSSTLILSKFKDNIIIFLDEMIEVFNEKEFIVFRVMIDNVSINKIMHTFVEDIIPLKEKIRNRELKGFFEVKQQDEKTTLFMNCIYKILQSDNVDDETKQVIWTWLDQFVKLAERYHQFKNT